MADAGVSGGQSPPPQTAVRLRCSVTVCRLSLDKIHCLLRGSFDTLYSKGVDGIIPTYQRWRLRFREVKALAQGHEAR